MIVIILETKKYHLEYYEEFWNGNFEKLPEVMSPVQSSCGSPATLYP